MRDPERDDPDRRETSELLTAVASGDDQAAAQLLPLVYEQLRRAAEKQLGHERRDHTLSATALVHEAYLRLVGPRRVPWAGQAHFYAAAAQAMRRILIDHARSKHARGGVPLRLDAITDVGTLAAAGPEHILAVEAAMVRLEAEDDRAAEVVRLRFFAGLSVDQAADVMGVSPRTVARLWTFARASPFEGLSDEISGSP